VLPPFAGDYKYAKIAGLTPQTVAQPPHLISAISGVYPLCLFVPPKTPSKLTPAHDAVTEVLSHKHHLIICASVDPIQLVYGSSPLFATNLTHHKNYSCYFSQGILYACACTYVHLCVYIYMKYICTHIHMYVILIDQNVKAYSSFSSWNI